MTEDLVKGRPMQVHVPKMRPDEHLSSEIAKELKYEAIDRIQGEGEQQMANDMLII